MYHKRQFNIYKNHLIKRYSELIEKSNDYRFEDEAQSDLAAYKAMKIQEKINQVRYLDREVTF
ncbi:MAG: hypothetical protein WAO74_02370 [Polaribacter sp.]|uniref:hypothetical protein n=1 Tax=Polaribacter sp. TaxID=1920175 RepID=UPI003BB0932C